VANDVGVIVKRVSAERLDRGNPEKHLKDVHGILVPGGFGYRGIEGKVKAIQYARENKIPYLGLCLGMQCAVIEFARNVAGLKGANSTEFNKKTAHPVISLLEEQEAVKDMGGTMRLGALPCHVKKDSLAHEAYKAEEVMERHRHRYEFNNKYREQFTKLGLRISGTSPGNKLVEMVELEDHPWFVASQFHPEFKSRPDHPHPLFREFIRHAFLHSQNGLPSQASSKKSSSDENADPNSEEKERATSEVA